MLWKTVYLRDRGGGAGRKQVPGKNLSLSMFLANAYVTYVRTYVYANRRTLILLRSVAIKLEDGTPIAWAFLGKAATAG